MYYDFMSDRDIADGHRLCFLRCCAFEVQAAEMKERNDKPVGIYYGIRKI